MTGNGDSDERNHTGPSAGFISEWVDTENHDDDILSQMDQFASRDGFNVSDFMGWVSDIVDADEEAALAELPEVTTNAEDQED